MSVATGIPIFNGCIADWNELQIEFVSWCHFYHNIYTGYERPDNKIIDDDEKLDNWLAAKRLEMHKASKITTSDDSYTDRETEEEFNTFDENA